MIYKLPRKHALDWFDRCGINFADRGQAEILSITARTITLDLSPKAMEDLRADAEYYAECMGPADTGDTDYRPAAKTLLRHLKGN